MTRMGSDYSGYARDLSRYRIENENKRLKEALEKIAAMEQDYTNHIVEDAIEIAKDALKSGD